MAIGMGGIGTSANASTAAVNAASAKPAGVGKKPTSTTSVSGGSGGGGNRAKRLHNLRLQNAINPGPSADADCYTCRRRRVRCDRALPTCRKCAKADHECAGYKKGFRWVGGIASRGKMMGKSTFDEDAMEEGMGPEEGPSVNHHVQQMPVLGMSDDNNAITEQFEDIHSSTKGERLLREVIVPGFRIQTGENFHHQPSASFELFSPATEEEPLHTGASVEFPETSYVDQLQPPQLQTQGTIVDETDAHSLVSITNSSTQSAPTTLIETVAKRWTHYFATSLEYSFSRARSGHYYFIVPEKELNAIYGKQYTLGFSAGPDFSSGPPEIDVSIASLIDFYVSTPSAAPSMIGSLDPSARYYLSFFDQMCGIFLLYDRHPLNPYRELLLSTLHFAEPALLSTILAVAARYHANVTGHNYNSNSLRPDLLYYNQALNFLNQDLQDEERMLMDTTLASVLFFLFYETMDSGLDTWRVHLSGARKLVELKHKRMGMQPGNLTHMQAFILHSIALFDIIGSTLVTDRQPSVLALPSLSGVSTSSSSNSLTSLNYTPAMSTTAALTTIDNEVFPILVRGEMFCFLACPPEILQIILKITILSSHSYLMSQINTPEPTIQEFLNNRATLVHQISSFDPTQWMTKHQQGSTITANKEDLWHHVEAYKTAVLIYLYRSLFLPHELENMNNSPPPTSVASPDDDNENNEDHQILPTGNKLHNTTLPNLASTLFYHLDQIPITGSLYKGTVWPCFIAGTEARTREQKARVRRHFDTLWQVLYCWNVRNGIGVLEELWGEKNGAEGRIIEEEDEEDVEEEQEAQEMEKNGEDRLGEGNTDDGDILVHDQDDAQGRNIGGTRVRARVRAGSSTSISSASTSTSGSTTSSGGRSRTQGYVGGTGQDWKSYLKRKGVEWLII